MGRKAHTLETILSKTIKDPDFPGCLIWSRVKDKDGYGLTSILGVKMPAHRAVMSFLTDVTGKYVLHKCEQRGCINPDHLYVGDQKQNVQDQINAGTFVYGSKNGMSLLEESEVLEIRASGKGNMELSKLYGVSYYTIWEIKTGRSWKHLL